MLGYPQSTVELTNSQIAMCIDDALDIFTKYSSHYTTEYVALWPSLYKKNCGFDLSEIPEFCGNSQQCVSYYTYESVVTGVDIIKTNLGTGYAMISAKGFNPYDFCYGDETDIKNPNNPRNPNYDPRNPVDTTTKPQGNDVLLMFDKDNIWDFEICGANSITISSVSSEDFDYETLVESTSAYLVVKNGKGYLYRDKEYLNPCPDKCTPLSAWWNGFDLSEATHVRFPNIPNFCKDQEMYPLQKHDHDNKIPMFTICNSAIDTNGEIITDVEFYNACPSVIGLTGSFYSNTLSGIANYNNILSGSEFKEDIVSGLTNDWINTGLGINFELKNCVQETPCARRYEVSFDKITTVEYYGTSAIELSGTVFDHDLQNKRKVRNVSKVEPNSYGGFAGFSQYMGGVFGLEYPIMNQMFGFNGMGGRSAGGETSYRLFDHNLMMGLLETMKYQLNYIKYEFNPKTQFLRVFPEPNTSYNSNKGYVARLHVTQPIKDLINEPWVRQYALATSKIILGRIRSKYQGVTLPNGITIQGNDVLGEGIAERDALYTQLVTQTGADKRPPLAFMSL
jgi:hypothetical protein